MAANDGKALTPAQVAHRLNVATSTVRRWATTGQVRSFRLPGGQLRFRPVDIDAIDSIEDDDQPAAS